MRHFNYCAVMTRVYRSENTRRNKSTGYHGRNQACSCELKRICHPHALTRVYRRVCRRDYAGRNLTAVLRIFPASRGQWADFLLGNTGTSQPLAAKTSPPLRAFAQAGAGGKTGVQHGKKCRYRDADRSGKKLLLQLDGAERDACNSEARALTFFQPSPCEDQLSELTIATCVWQSLRRVNYDGRHTRRRAQIPSRKKQ